MYEQTANQGHQASTHYENMSGILEIGGSSSSRSRRMEIEGIKPFAWSREKPRTEQPYMDGRFHLPHNPPPNELAFVGGIGSNVGRARSRVHPQRPTLLQQIFGMRNRNRRVHSFTQPSEDLHCCVQKQSKKPDFKDIVKRVSAADMMTSRMSTLDSGSVISPNSDLKMKESSVLVASDEDVDDETVDGQSIHFGARRIAERIRTIVEHTNENDPFHSISRTLPEVSEVQAFNQWARQLRTNTADRMRNDVDSTLDGISVSRNRTKSGSSLSEDPASYTIPAVKMSVNRVRPVVAAGTSRRIFRNITGYMYGPFTEQDTPDSLTQHENKFGVPQSMTNRAQRFQKRDVLQSDLMRRHLMSRMGLPQPPTKNADSSGDDDKEDSTIEVKKLALVRTPYFSLPAVRVDRVKRVPRNWNKYLCGDRLARINLLLRDDKKMRKPSAKNTDDGGPSSSVQEQMQKGVLSKFAQLAALKRSLRKDTSNRDPEKAKFNTIIDEDYERNISKLHSREKTPQPITFGQFKKIPDPVDLQHLSIKLDKLEVRSDGIETDRTRSMRSRSVTIRPHKLFERKRNERLPKDDNLDGPFYIDPNLMDHLRSLEKNDKAHKFYTSLMKGKHWIRDRLQVNGPQFEEEKVGIGSHKYHHRLASEWDEYYFHDLRQRPRIRKFCMKSDILAIRDICRRNFVMYNVQEHLMELQSKQKKETEYLNEVEEFQYVCVTEFGTMKNVAYARLAHAIEESKNLEDKIGTSRSEETVQLLALDCIQLRVFQLEEIWNYLMTLQNYYYLLQSTEWRSEHDWIHRSAVDGSLETPMEAYTKCTQRYIRPSRESSGHKIKAFFEENIEPNLVRMLKVQPDAKELQSNLVLLNANCLKGLIQHNNTFWTFKGILGMSSRLLQQLTDANQHISNIISILKTNVELLLDRSKEAEIEAIALIETSLPTAVRSPMERTVLAISSQLHQHLRQSGQLVNGERETGSTPIQKFECIHGMAMELFDQLDALPLSVLRLADKLARRNRHNVNERLADALTKQKRYDLMRRQIENHFSAIAQFRRVKAEERMFSIRKSVSN